jgi:FlaA1/EpsC-like NDP-sugar epimerase
MKRYFMSIPEAVSLVLQAGSMADDGKIFLFDMGEPASILAMARQMIRLAGLRPDEDIEIKITGRRRGERLLERLYDDNESVAPTSHPSIWSVNPTTEFDPATLVSSLRVIEASCTESCSAEALAVLQELLVACGVRCELGLNETPDVEYTVSEERSVAPVLASDGKRPTARASPT